MLRAIWTHVRLLSGTTANRFRGQRMKHGAGCVESFLQETRWGISGGSQLCGSISLKKRKHGICKSSLSHFLWHGTFPGNMQWTQALLCMFLSLHHNARKTSGLVSNLQWETASPEARTLNWRLQRSETYDKYAYISGSASALLLLHKALFLQLCLESSSPWAAYLFLWWFCFAHVLSLFVCRQVWNTSGAFWSTLCRRLILLINGCQLCVFTT